MTTENIQVFAWDFGQIISLLVERNTNSNLK